MGKGDDEDNMKTLRDVVDGQRQIIERVYQRPASEVKTKKKMHLLYITDCAKSKLINNCSVIL